MVVVDRVLKMAHFIVVKDLPSVGETATLFMDHIIGHHRLPVEIVSDHRVQFTSNFWKALCTLDISHHLSSACYPQFNGHTESMNQCMEIYLR